MLAKQYKTKESILNYKKLEISEVGDDYVTLIIDGFGIKGLIEVQFDGGQCNGKSYYMPNGDEKLITSLTEFVSEEEFEHIVNLASSEYRDKMSDYFDI